MPLIDRPSSRLLRSLLLTSLSVSGSVSLVLAGSAGAQTGAAPRPAASDQQIRFSADTLDYDEPTNVVTAGGSVVVRRDGDQLEADRVVWDRTNGDVTAEGNVRITSRDGNTVYGDKIIVSETLRDGVVDNLLIVLGEGGRLAALSGKRDGDSFELKRAVYSPCAVETEEGCPKEPTWQVKADEVRYDAKRQRVRYRGARVELLGLGIIPLPGLSHPAGEAGGAGLLVPRLRLDRTNGLEIAVPYYWRLAPNRDLTLTPHVYSESAPMLSANYRALTDRGAYTINAYGTYSDRTSIGTEEADTARKLRGYFTASGKFQLDSLWSLTGSAQVATDRTFLRRYDISFEDRLRSTVRLERLDSRSMLSIAGWATQTLRSGDPQGQVPIALPVIDYRLRMADPLVGGQLELQANSLAIVRTAGQDTQRAFMGARWSRGTITRWGQQLDVTAYARTDVYHTSDGNLTSSVLYRGTDGWRSRAIGALAFDIRMPFVGATLGGAQRITPRVQFVAAPRLSNLAVPNEDARSVELEDSNLFALNRFPGYDRVEDSSRITYGLDYALDLGNIAFTSVVGQSYRVSQRPSILPDGTGLSDRFSDIVGRSTVRYRDLVSLTHRFRVDKDSLAVRRNEIDATIGTRQTYAKISYLRLNRNIVAGVEDLRDREEVRLAGRVAFARFWSVFGSTVVDLTGQREDPVSSADGYEPIRHRLGIAYQDDCTEIGVTWRRDYSTTGDVRRGNSFLLRLAFRNLGI